MERKAVGNTGDNPIDFKRYGFTVLKYWYVVVLCLLIALGYGYYLNKYTPKTYQVAMSLLIKENQGQENSAALLFNNSMIKPYINYYNEPYLLKADPLIAQIIQKLGFTTSFYLQGNIKTTEIYPGLPLTFLPDSINGATLPFGEWFWIQILNNRQFQIKPYTEDEPSFTSEHASYEFGQWITLGGQQVQVQQQFDQKSVSDFYQQPFIVSLSHPQQLVGQYTGKLAINWAEEGAGVLNLSTVGEIPAKEIDFLKTLAQTYIELDLIEKNQNATNTINFISEQLQQIGDSLSLIERRLENFKRENVGVGMDARTNELFGRLQGLEQQKNQNVLQERYFEYIRNYIEKGMDSSDIIAPASLGISDPVLNTLISQLITLQLQKEELKRTTKVDHPMLLSFNQRINDLKENILENIQNQKGSLDISRNSLSKEINTIEKDIRKLPKTEREFVNIQRVYKLSENLYNYLLEKRAEASITKASSTSDISIINPPKQVSGAITPDTRGNYIKAIMLGLGLPLGALFLLFYFNNKVQYKEDLEKHTTIPILGMVGHKLLQDNLVVYEKPKSAIAESFRAIRSNLNFFTSAAEDSKVFLVTSSISGEGKTFCSINLASVFAYSGKKTLIVGADLRKPKIFQDFGLSNEIGLSNYLVGINSLEQVVQPTKLSNLDLISGGIIPPNPSELLMSQRMSELLQILKEQYDVIIIDSPPLGLVTDSQVLMPHADHTIFVVRQNYTTIPLLKNAQEAYSGGKFKNISLLLNDVKVANMGYGYSYGYGYYEEDERNNRKKRFSRYLNFRA